MNQTEPLVSQLVKRLILISIVLFTTLLISISAGIACGCGPTMPTPQAYEASSDVFIGRVVEIQLPSSKTIDGSPGAGTDMVLFELEESLKGVQGPQVLLNYGTGACEYPFMVGERYLVYAGWEDGKFRTSKCNRTRELSRATPDLKYIRGLANQEAQATVYGLVLRLGFDEKGKAGLYTPWEELTVVLEGADSRLEAKSEKSGDFEMTVPPGDYQVWVERAGQRVSEKIEAIKLKLGDCTREVLPVEFK